MTNPTMQKINPTSPQAQSADLVAANIAQLKALFPELLTEGQNGPALMKVPVRTGSSSC